MKKQKLVILGSTGSIGEQALEIVREHPDLYEVLAISCNTNWEALSEQVNEFTPEYALVCDEGSFGDLQNSVNDLETELMAGTQHLTELASLAEADIVLNSLVGFAGFEPTVEALKSGNKVALANKESLVVGGQVIDNIISGNRDMLVPVDSEHSAILQCLTGESAKDIEKLIITASGGPFRTWSRKSMEDITVEQALDHPNWSMGAKITIDSATMMNKGLEIIEAHWLFDLPLSKIEAVVHPQSIIHSIVEFVDGSSKAQLGPPTMKVPILYALTYPDRLPLDAPRINWKESFELTFEEVDYEKFPCVKLAIDSINIGGGAPAVLNAANEIAVDRFLNKEIPYIGIPKIIETCLAKIDTQIDLRVGTLKEIDLHTREIATNI